MPLTEANKQITTLKEKVQGYTTDKSYKGMIVTVIIALIVLIIAFFMNIIKWVLFVTAVVLFLSVGYRGFLKWKSSRKNNDI